MKFNSEVMDLNINSAVAYLTFKKLDEYSFINHAFSTRLGGVSTGKFKSMNLSFQRGDKQENVMENYKLFCDSAGFDLNSIVIPHITHGTNIRVAIDNNRGSGIFRHTDFDDADGLVTNKKGITLATSHADCQPIFVVDPNKRAVGLCHAGWRGTVKGIAREIVNKMVVEFESNVKNLVCCIGPSIAKCCFEVGHEVANEFSKIEFINQDDVILENEGKYRIDLFEANKQILINSGVDEDNIVLSDICTMCGRDLLFSHRGTNGERGSLMAMIAIK